MVSGFHQIYLSGHLTQKTQEISVKLLHSVMKYSIYTHQFQSPKAKSVDPQFGYAISFKFLF